MKNNFAKYLVCCLLCWLLLTAQVVAASAPEDEVDEYKAPSGGWKIIHKMDRKSNGYENDLIKAVSPAGKETVIKKWLNLVSVTWRNSDVAEIIDTCGIPCKNMYFFDTIRGVSNSFLNVIAYSIKNNLIVSPSYNKKKERAEIVISEIYTKKKKPIAIVYRKWEEISFEPIVDNAVINNNSLYIEYRDKDCDEVKKENISLKKESPFVICDDNSSEGENKEIEYCSIADDDYKKGYIWFAAEEPPVGMMDTPKESPLCYRFPSFRLDGQLQKLKDKYGIALYDEKITKEPDGSSSLSAKRKDESGKEIVYAYFDDPKSCAEYQTKRLGEAPPVPYYDYGGCVGACCPYNTTWTAEKEVVLRKNHSDSSPAVAKIEAEEKVDALTGVVITQQTGKIKVIKDMTLKCGELKLPFINGEYIHTIHNKGEIQYLIWRKGQMHECNIYLEEESIQKMNEEQTEWWIKISTKNGTIGWTREVGKFNTTNN